MILQRGKYKEKAVDPRHQFRQDITESAAGQSAGQSDRQAELEKVQKHLPIAVAEGLERADDRPLLLGEPGEQHVEHERRDRQEDHRHEDRERLQPFHLLAEVLVRKLIGQRDRREHAEVGQEQFGAVEDFPGGDRRPGGEPSEHLVGRPVEVEYVLGIRLLEEKDAEVLRVGDDRARREHVDELGGDRRPHHVELLAAVVQHQLDPIAGRQAVGLGEGLVDDHLVRPAVAEIGPAAEHDVVDHRLAPVGH